MAKIAAGLLLAAGAVAVYFYVVAEEVAPPPSTVSAGPLLFADVTEAAGLYFVHDAGPLPSDGKYFMPQIMGSGAAFFDADGDGLLDIYLLTGGGPKADATNRLYRQLPGGRFQDASAGSGLDFAGYNAGVAVGDANNDGRPDVLVTQFGGLKLLLNLGGGRFRDATTEAGLESSLWGTSAAFVDNDRDGWLDLVVVNYVEYDPTRICDRGGWDADYCPPRNFGGQIAKLFRNLGGQDGAVRFRDVTLQAGLGKSPSYGLGVVAADFTGDGWPDLFVANDAQPNFLWVNRRDGTFAEEAVQRGVAYNGLGQTQGNMGVALGDVDGDGLFDLFVTHLDEEYHTLWKQGPRGLFRDATAAARLHASCWKGTGFGTVLADFDRDGHLDLALVNGKVHRTRPVPHMDPAAFWSYYAERPQLFLNDGAGAFRDVSPANAPFCGTPLVARGLAWGDYDGDGAIDLLVTTVAGPARLFRNVSSDRGHWLIVRAVDPGRGGRDAYGAEIRVRAGGRVWLGAINPANSYQCSSDARAHFGFGPIDRIDAVEVTWPEGGRETFAVPELDRAVVLRKGEGRP